jgi:hypothetical protein
MQKRKTETEVITACMQKRKTGTGNHLPACMQKRKTEMGVITAKEKDENG